MSTTDFESTQTIIPYDNYSVAAVQMMCSTSSSCAKWLSVFPESLNIRGNECVLSENISQRYS